MFLPKIIAKKNGILCVTMGRERGRKGGISGLDPQLMYICTKPWKQLELPTLAGESSAARVHPASKNICTIWPVSNLHCNGPTPAKCKHRHNCTIKLQQSAKTRKERAPVEELTDAIHRVSYTAGMKRWVFRNILAELPREAGSLRCRGCHCRLLRERRVQKGLTSGSKDFHVLQTRVPTASLQQRDIHHHFSLRISYFFAQ